MNPVVEELIWRAVPETAVRVFHEHEEELLEKGAESPLMKNLANLWQIRPAQAGDAIPWNAPGPLSSMLVGGMAGAGLGYGAGYLGEKLFPERWQRGKLRRTLALMGGGLGAAPGMAYAATNMINGQPFWKPTIQAGYEYPNEGKGIDLTPRPKPFPDYAWNASSLEGDKIGSEIKEAFERGQLRTGIGSLTPIPVNEFNQVIWNDPRVARPLSPGIRAAATGLVTGAANLPGRRNTRYVSPMDIGRIAAGMGTGYVSGALVGKALSTLMGMPSETQEKLKQTGLWAGIIANVVPIAFGE